MKAELPDTFFIVCLLIPIACYIIAQYMGNPETPALHTEQYQTTLEECLKYLDEMIPASVRPAAITVPKKPSVSASRADRFIGKCSNCLAPAAARCSGCKSIPYCSRKCQLIHWKKEHKDKCDKLLRPSADVAHKLRPQMDFLVGLKSTPHGKSTKKCAIQEGTSDDQFGTQAVKNSYNEGLEMKRVGAPKQTELKYEGELYANSELPNISSEELPGIFSIEETMKNQDVTMSNNTPQNHDERTKDSGQRNEQINSPAKIRNSGSNMYADFEVGLQQNRNMINEAEGHIFGKGPLRETTDCIKPSFNLKKSIDSLEELHDNEDGKEHFLELQNPQHVLCQTENNSMQSHETKRLEVIRMEVLQDENNALRNINNEYAKEVESLRQQLEKQASKNYQVTNFMEFSYLELEQATNNFDEKLKIGEGGYGDVYKGVLHCTTVAIKILRAGGTQGGREFYKEVEMLKKVRHPNIVTLIGGCSQHLALVYEFIPNDSLEKYLGDARCRGPLSWKTRIEIASNICSALIFLHSTKPHGIAHGDLKPANILLDANYQGKLSDFGISCQLMKADDTITPFHLTDIPKGTRDYIDPEYLQTGEMNPQCDVYSLGVVLLQLVTGKSATGIVKLVQDALQGQSLKKKIDSSAKWPFDKAIKLAKLGLHCCNPARKNRPNLAIEVWSEIESMKSDAPN